VAAHNGCADVVKILIEYKAEINGVNDAGLTPLLSAVCSHHPSNECVQLLVDGRADVNAELVLNKHQLGKGIDPGFYIWPFLFEGGYDKPEESAVALHAANSALHVLALRLGMWTWGDQAADACAGGLWKNRYFWCSPSLTLVSPRVMTS